MLKIKELLLSSILALSGCAKTNLFNSEEFVFKGIDQLIDNGDGTFKLTWAQVPESEINYLIYSKPKSSAFNFSVPAAQVTVATWTTPNLRFSGDTCFVVRFVKPGVVATDFNEHEVCTGKEVFEFKGLKEVVIADNGGLTLRWDEIPQSDVSYQVFSTSTAGSYDFSKPIGSPTKGIFKIDPYALSVKQCYVVHYSIVGAPEDKNVNEICPALPYITNFAGIVSATSYATGMATLTWAAPTGGTADIASYKVYVGAGFVELKGTAASTDTSLTVANLPVDEVVTFGVRVVDKYGREDTNTKTITASITNNVTPSFAGLTSATQMSGQKSVALAWVAADGKISQYKVYYGVGAAATTPAVSYTTPIATTNGTTLATTVSGLGDELAYCFDVRAVTSGGQESSTSNVKCVNITDFGAPTFAGITGASFSAGGAQITWTPSVDQVTSYYVYYQQGTSINFSTANFQIITNPAPPATQVSSATLAGLQDNTQYTFAVRALDKRSQLDANVATRTATSGDLTPPVFLGVTSLVAVDDTHLQITYNRSTEGDMHHYSIRVRETAAGGAFTEITTTLQPGGAPATVTTTISGLMPATSYDVLVKSVDAAGNVSTNTLSSTRATLDVTPPTFSGLSAVALDPSDASKVKVSWTAASDSSGIVGYRVYSSTSPMTGCAANLKSTFVHPHSYAGCGAAVNMSSLISSNLYLSFAGLTEGSTYYFIVHAIDNSVANNEDTNTVMSAFNVPYYTPPAVPGSLAITGGNGPSASNTLTLTGTGALGNTVKVYVNTIYSTQTILNSGTSFSILVTLPTTPGTYSITASQVNISSVEGNQSTPINYILQNQAPTATISGMPCSPTSCATNANSLNITVAGTNVATYQYALLYNVATTCAAAGYGNWTAVATHITDLLNVTGDGTYRLCVLGKDAAGNSQDISTATQFDFTRDTVAPNPPATLSLKNAITNSTAVTFAAEVVATMTASSSISAVAYCVTATNSAPAANAACWSTNLTPTIVLSTGNAYAWSKTSSGQVSATSTSASITFTNLCNTGALATGQTCTISSARTIANNDVIAGPGNMLISSTGSITGLAFEKFTITITGDLTVNNGSGNRITGNVTINAANVTILGVVTAEGMGYQGSNGNGLPGSSGGQSSGGYGGGGGHAGAGSHAAWNLAGSTLGGIANSSLNVAAPVTYGGSGGGGTIGLAGGGAIKIVASGVLSIDGVLSANGQSYGVSPLVGSTYYYSGGGAGGSLWITAGSMSGAGTISAKGGTGGGAGAGGNGGGGAISITSSNAFKSTIDVSAGYYQASGIAGPGKLYTNYTNPCDIGSLAGDCTISSSITVGTNQTFSVGGNLTIASGGSLKVPARGQSMTIAVTGNLLVQNNGAILGNLTDLTAANVTVDFGGSINANYYGYAMAACPAVVTTCTDAPTAYAGFGAAHGSGTGAGSGGAHGGRGGASYYYGTIINNASSIGAPVGSAGAMPYDSVTQPVLFGGPGGLSAYGATASVATQEGQAGGGAIKISTAGTLTVNGNITANGSTGLGAGGNVNTGGGGAGGSIWLNVSTMAGNGNVRADGGAGGATTSTVNPSGGGGGGRIAAYHTNKFSGTFSVAGGAASNANAFPGEMGTVYFANNKDNYCASAGTLSTTCTISQVWALSNGSTLTATGNLIFASGGSFYTYRGESATITTTGNITVQSGATLQGNITINASNLTVDSGGFIIADGWGYLGLFSSAGQGPAPANAGGFGNTSSGGGGGGHGGAGGTGNGGQGAMAGGTSYGSSTAPITFGASGGAANGYAGAAGGGALRINVTNTTTVNGTVSALGYTGATTLSGGGAGGSIYMTSNTVSGGGSILANGGNGGNNNGGGGGGGRIAITRSTDTFSGTRTANGGTAGAGGLAAAGSNGSVVLQ